MVYAVDKATGTSLWKTRLAYSSDVNTDRSGYGTALVAGLLIIGDIDVFGINPLTGAIVWRFAPRLTYPSEREFQRFTTDGTTIYCGGVWGNVYAIDAATGVQRWISHVTTLPDSFIRVFNPVLASGALFTAFTNDRPGGQLSTLNGGVAAFDPASGRLLWSQDLPRKGTTSETDGVVVTSTRVVTGAWDGTLYGLDPQTGAILDTVSQTTFGFPAGTTLGGWFRLAVTDSVVVAGLSNGMMVALDARNLQRTLWSYTSQQGAILDVAIDAGRVYSSYLNGAFAVTDIATGKLVWWIGRFDFKPNAEYIGSAGAFDGNRVYVDADQDVYAFQRR